MTVERSAPRFAKKLPHVSISLMQRRQLGFLQRRGGSVNDSRIKNGGVVNSRVIDGCVNGHR
jgi:hypothetical protein